MINLELLLNRFVEDPESLDETELAALVQAVEDEPELAVRLRDQLVLDELLAQKLDPERQGFRAQIEQRLADLERGEEEIAEQIHAMRELAIGQLSESGEPAGGGWRLLAIALSLLIAAGIASYLFWPAAAPLARLEQFEGQGALLRGGARMTLAAGIELHEGDEIVTEGAAAAQLVYPDGTWVRVFEDSALRIGQDRTSRGKRVYLDRGRLVSSIAPQPADRPMLFISPTATARIVGTEIWLVADKDSTELVVTDGKVEFWQSSAPRVVVVGAGETGRVAAGLLEVKEPLWPAERRLLAFGFATKSEPALVRNGKTKALHSTRLLPQGNAGYNERGGLQLSGGSFRPEHEDTGRHIAAVCQETNEITLEAVLRSERGSQTDATQVIAFADADSQPLFSLAQKGSKLIWSMPGETPAGQEVSLGELPQRKTTHCVVSYRPGHLACYLDGAKVYEDSAFAGGPAEWQARGLTFGADSAGERSWRGTLEGVAIYHRFFAEEDAQRSAAAFQAEYLHAASDENWKELLPLENLAAHAVGGRWLHDREGVRGEAQDEARLVLPLAPDGNYQLEIEFTRAAGDAAARVVFPVGNSQALLSIDAGLPAAPHAGLGLIDGKGGDANPTTLNGPILENGRRYKLQIEVITSGGRCHVQARLENQHMLEWSGDARSLALDPRYQAPDRRLAALVSGGPELRFHAARLKMLSGQALE